MTACNIFIQFFNKILLLVLLSIVSSIAYLLAHENDCPKKALIDLSNGSQTKNGSIQHQDFLYPPETVRWLNGFPMGCICKVRGCLPLCCQNTGCNHTVTKITKTTLDPLFNTTTLQIIHNMNAQDLWQFSWDPCNSTESFHLEPNSLELNKQNDRFNLLSNGSLYHWTINSIRNFYEYCIDSKNGFDMVKVCFDELSRPESLDTGIHDFFWSLVASEIGLIATLVVYLLLPELRNLPGKNLFCYIVCLTWAYAFLLLLQRKNPEDLDNFYDINICIIGGKILIY